jgi:hypothetical protein
MEDGKWLRLLSVNHGVQKTLESIGRMESSYELIHFNEHYYITLHDELKMWSENGVDGKQTFPNVQPRIRSEGLFQNSGSPSDVLGLQTTQAWWYQVWCHRVHCAT